VTENGIPERLFWTGDIYKMDFSNPVDRMVVNRAEVNVIQDVSKRALQL
jgi:hypothetical protein